MAPTLPSYLLDALDRPAPPMIPGKAASIARAKHKVALHRAVAKAIRERAISPGKGGQILMERHAFGPKGRAAIEDAILTS